MPDFLESREFYELMQAYRHAPVAFVNGCEAAATAFEAVKAFIREQLAAQEKADALDG